MGSDHSLIETLDSSIASALNGVLRGHRQVALLDFPNHSNVGDSAIYLGERTYLHRAGITVVYSCQYNTYSRESLARAIGDGVILLHGGGNFGDLWPEYQRFRESVVADFPDNPVIQLPQTIHFTNPGTIARARAAFSGHRHFHLLVRDRRSLAIAQDQIGIAATLCPDMAFALGPLDRPAPPEVPVLWLARTDQESAGTPAGLRTVDGTTRVDWLEDRESIPFRVTRKLAHVLPDAAPSTGVSRHLLTWSYRRLAAMRVRRGCALLSRGQVVVADRLHAHILCLLLGIPHFLVDNTYGKLRSFYEAWTSPASLVHWCGSLAEALERAAAAARASR